MQRNLLVFLGAGASTPYGLPILSRLFEVDNVRNYLSDDPKRLAFFQERFWRPNGLTLDTASKGPHLEKMMDELLLAEGDREKARRSIKYREQRLLLDNVAYRALAHNRSARMGVFNDFIRWTEEFADRVVVATFNWDLMYEASYYHSFGQAKQNPRLGMNVEGWTNSERKTTLLKLHGSLNWWYDGNKLTYKTFGSYGGQPSALDSAWKSYTSTSPEVPLIVEPSGYKQESLEQSILDSQWELLKEAAASSSHVISIGYSWPDNDKTIREKVFREFSSSGKGLKILDINPDPRMKESFNFFAEKIEARPISASEFFGVNGVFQAPFST